MQPLLLSGLTCILLVVWAPTVRPAAQPLLRDLLPFGRPPAEAQAGGLPDGGPLAALAAAFASWALEGDAGAMAGGGGASTASARAQGVPLRPSLPDLESPANVRAAQALEEGALALLAAAAERLGTATSATAGSASAAHAASGTGGPSGARAAAKAAAELAAWLEGQAAAVSAFLDQQSASAPQGAGGSSAQGRPHDPAAELAAALGDGLAAIHLGPWLRSALPGSAGSGAPGDAFGEDGSTGGPGATRETAGGEVDGGRRRLSQAGTAAGGLAEGATGFIPGASANLGGSAGVAGDSGGAAGVNVTSGADGAGGTGGAGAVGAGGGGGGAGVAIGGSGASGAGATGGAGASGGAGGAGGTGGTTGAGGPSGPSTAGGGTGAGGAGGATSGGALGGYGGALGGYGGGGLGGGGGAGAAGPREPGAEAATGGAGAGARGPPPVQARPVRDAVGSLLLNNPGPRTRITERLLGAYRILQQDLGDGNVPFTGGRVQRRCQQRPFTFTPRVEDGAKREFVGPSFFITRSTGNCAITPEIQARHGQGANVWTQLILQASCLGPSLQYLLLPAQVNSAGDLPEAFLCPQCPYVLRLGLALDVSFAAEGPRTITFPSRSAWLQALLGNSSLLGLGGIDAARDAKGRAPAWASQLLGSGEDLMRDLVDSAEELLQAAVEAAGNNPATTARVARAGAKAAVAAAGAALGGGAGAVAAAVADKARGRKRGLGRVEMGVLDFVDAAPLWGLRLQTPRGAAAQRRAERVAGGHSWALQRQLEELFGRRGVRGIR
ncbi:hypothetical protein HYH03_008166 [Edaphochlamys debaryana]|uniref:Uncharacterized protein n=1 Tax=Edaphochlamys debaryana TaxID=47281 RepID=A0A835Y1P2_9CHLO|nr:hypothetical protein HYH03_008166 [Edaphochlamys debaryana]|eukprot:KAG2493649.1 hypothetical protein HYH03_008166 [Edaphochlamys debaryana]